MEVIYKNKNGKLIQGDNVEVMKELNPNIIDTCISDFPYDLSFMSRAWDTTGNFYEWNKARAKELFRIIKPGGFALIFGHAKTNHRMKCAFEDVGFKIVEEIDWIYFTGFPKNQDIGKMFDKKAGAKREVVGYQEPFGREGRKTNGKPKFDVEGWDTKSGLQPIEKPSTKLAKQWNGWKTAGLKPSKEPITVFQKPLEGTYCDNIEKWEVGGFNIDACRIKHNEPIKTTNRQKDMGDTWNKDNCGLRNNPTNMASADPSGRFPPNIIFDEITSEMLNEQTGVRTSGSNCVRTKEGSFVEHGGLGKAGDVQITYGDSGGGSRFFYCAKPSPSDKKLLDGTKNTHITVKPVNLIKWLIKLTTPKNGVTIDITAGSCTHAVAVEELNRNEDYNLKWLNIEMLNSEKEPYCEIGKKRIEAIHNQE